MRGLGSMLLSGACLLLASGCGQAPDPPAASQRQPDHERHAAGLVLELDGGRKWQVDEHTRGSARELTQRIERATPIETAADAQALAAALDEGLQGLIQGCTMTGPAHDQLHVFLAALFPRVTDLKTKTDPEELRAVQRKIDSLFDAYALHFE